MDNDKIMVELIEKISKIQGLIETDLKNINVNMARVEDKVDKLDKKVTTKQEFIEDMKLDVERLKERQIELSSKVTSLETKYTRVMYAFMGVLFSIVAYFVVPFFTR